MRSKVIEMKSMVGGADWCVHERRDPLVSAPRQRIISAISDVDFWRFFV